MIGKFTLRRAPEYALPALVLIFLLLYCYTYFFEMPYLGFDFNNANGVVVKVWGEQPDTQSLKPGDRLLQVGLLDWATLSGDNRQPLLRNVESGDVVKIRVQRVDQEITIPWRLPGPSPEELIARSGVIWTWFIFWLAGTVTIFLVRPRSTRWKLLIAYFYLMAAWLLVGWVSSTGILYSRILLRMIAWLLMPIFFHLSWIFPRPLARISIGLLWAVYLCAGILSGLEFFQLLPQHAYVIGLLITLGTSVVLLTLHAVLQPDVRGDLKVLAAAILLACLSGLLLSFQALTQIALQVWLVLAALLSISAIPGAYFYVIYRHQMGELELKANRIISFYLFSVLLITFSIFAVWFITIKTDTRIPEVAIDIAGLFFIGLVTALIYPYFQRLIEQRLLGIPIAPAHLIEAYAAKITTSLDSESLVNLLRDEILPSLLVRQSTLIRISNDNTIKPLYQTGVAESAVPDKTVIPILLEKSGKYRPPDADDSMPVTLRWVCLILPLRVGGELIGVWLLGSRDPDNFYNQSEINILQTIANQTAIALINITHTELLHALYQADIEREENERAALARGLHDEVLNQLAAYFMRRPASLGASALEESEVLITNYIRKVISDLRPAMLNYGLVPAIDELVDNLSQRSDKDPMFVVDLAPDSARFDPGIEQHIFRIVQQACENAVRHAHAQTVQVNGTLKPDSIHLTVADDGIGFPAPGSQDLELLLKQEHYGLIGMYERASIIGADLRILSQHGQGTSVQLVWPKNGQE